MRKVGSVVSFLFALGSVSVAAAEDNGALGSADEVGSADEEESAARPAEETGVAPMAEESVDAPSAAPHYVGSFAVDPLGFLLFGPTATLEFGAGRWAGAASFRWFDPGLLAKELFLGGDSDSFAFSAGGGLRGRYYFADGFKGAHLGVLFELLAVNVDNSASLTRTKSLYFVPQLEGGYRFAWGRFFVGPSASVGYAAQLSGSVEDLPGGTSAGLYGAANRSSFYGSARLDLGILF